MRQWKRELRGMHLAKVGSEDGRLMELVQGLIQWTELVRAALESLFMLPQLQLASLLTCPL
jgi:hypothetical protein